MCSILTLKEANNIIIQGNNNAAKNNTNEARFETNECQIKSQELTSLYQTRHFAILIQNDKMPNCKLYKFQ